MGLTIDEGINYLDALYWNNKSGCPERAEHILKAKKELELAKAI